VARIRTIKPDFFRHEKLFEAEQQFGLPLRVAYAGLWTAADREGRFGWSPRALQLDCLPYDEVDFARVLDALLARGFIVKYAVNGKEYGCIPSWHNHQVINARERASTLPEPNEINTLTRASRVPDACPTRHVHAQGEGKGKEGKGTEGDMDACASPAQASATGPVTLFELFWEAYPAREGANPKEPARKKFLALVKSGVNPAKIIGGANAYANECQRVRQVGTQFVAGALKWLNESRWQDYQPKEADPKKVAETNAMMAAKGYSWDEGRGWVKTDKSPTEDAA